MLKYVELLKYASSDNFSMILEEWRDSGELMNLIPELAIMDEYVHNPEYHPEGCTEDSYGTALDHVIECVRIADNMRLSANEKICVLFHDIGKAITGSNYTKERPYHNFYGHEGAGKKIMFCIAKRMEIPQYEVDRLIFCIRNHMNAHRLTIMRPGKVQNIVLSPWWDDLKLVAWCDDASREEKFDMERWQREIDYGDFVLWSMKNPNTKRPF